jgi:signal transduction histidine kinase
VSGTIGEERAVESLKSGATDYVIKDRLASLGLKVQRALREVAERDAHLAQEAVDREAKRSLEEQLRQSQKMEAVGRLAGGVAHDFNNLLTVINGYSELLLSKLPSEDAMRADLEEIHEAGRRGASLTRQLLTFSRRQVTQPASLDLGERVRGLEKMLARLVGQDVRISITLAPDLWKVTADPGQIEQVIVNLVVNARDAMPKGGKISIEAANLLLGPDFVHTHPDARPGPHVMLSVSDGGVGISPEVMEHLFEPFFTTKGVGSGTGLGLSLVHGIVRQAGGTVQVSSEVGRGTTFKVILPRGKEEAPTPMRPPGSKPSVRGQETILLAEDQESVRRLAAVILESGGYKVLQASDGAEALNWCEEYDSPIHLLVTDLVMRTMTGVELAGLARRLHPESKLLLMSGYAYRSTELHDLIKAGLPFLEKPFTAEDLKRKVREVLGQS